MASICFDVLLVQINGKYSKLKQTRAQKNIFRNRGSLNNPQVRLIKPDLRIVLFFIISVRAEKFSFKSKITQFLKVSQYFNSLVRNIIIIVDRIFDQTKADKFVFVNI
jgi:hypothetical protein